MLASAAFALAEWLFRVIFGFTWHVHRDDWLGRNCLPRPCTAAFHQHRFGPLMGFDTYQRAAVLTACDFAEYKAKALPIIKERCHDVRCLHEEPQAQRSSAWGLKTVPRASGDGVGSCLLGSK
jgi:hypothetical protein